jgi:hypothetical protein
VVRRPVQRLEWPPPPPVLVRHGDKDAAAWADSANHRFDEILYARHVLEYLEGTNDIEVFTMSLCEVRKGSGEPLDSRAA